MLVRVALVKLIEHSFQEFVDAIQTADNELAFERIATRVTQQLGFKRFAYLRLKGGKPALISSYPKPWTERYFDLGYQQIDPVVWRASREHALFSWGGDPPAPAGTREHRRFFEEAMEFGIKSGITVPIRCGFGGMAAFTFSTDEPSARTEQLITRYGDVVQLVGLYFHAHVTTRLSWKPALPGSEPALTQRERQCLAWAARGKTAADIAVLIGIAPRTVVFHLENARSKFGATSVAQCVAEALRCGLLP